MLEGKGKSLGVVALGVIVAALYGCQKQGCTGKYVPSEEKAALSATEPVPEPEAAVPEKRLDAFLGIKLNERYNPKKCKKVLDWAGEFSAKTLTCEVEGNKAHTIYASFIIDPNFPQYEGKLVKVVAVMNRVLFGDSVALDAYFAAFYEKYGPMAPSPENSEKLQNINVKFCENGKCGNWLMVYDPAYPNMGWTERWGFGNYGYHTLSLTNGDIFSAAYARNAALKKQTAESIIK
jgi:hypothetical protein